MAKIRRLFTREFKLEAIKRITEQGRSLIEVSRDLEIRESTLRSWKQALATKGEQSFPGQGNLSALGEELRRLRAENRRLPMERDILKKATAFFARESS
jgi:transposase